MDVAAHVRGRVLPHDPLVSSLLITVRSRMTFGSTPVCLRRTTPRDRQIPKRVLQAEPRLARAAAEVEHGEPAAVARACGEQAGQQRIPDHPTTGRTD